MLCSCLPVLSICLPSLNHVTWGCGRPMALAVNWMEPPYSARRSLGDSRKKGKVGLGSGVGGSSMILQVFHWGSSRSSSEFS